jgi:hypothetical protein
MCFGWHIKNPGNKKPPSQSRAAVMARGEFFVRQGFLRAAHRMSFLIQATVGLSPSSFGSTGYYPNAFLMSSKCNRAHRHAARRSCVIEKLLSWSIFKTPHLFHLTHLAPLA